MPRHATGRRPKRDPDASLYVFKVALAGPKGVWRRIAMRSDQTFDDLHAAIFDAFDRVEEHLYSFYLPLPGSKGRMALRDAVEYTSPMMIEEAQGFGGGVVRDASLMKIGSLDLTTGRKLAYLFDFGDSWWHEITVEQTDGNLEQGKYPRVIQKHGDSPPQYPDTEDDDEEDDAE